MEHNNNQFGTYNTGADFWSDTVIKHDIEESVGICGRYLDMKLKREHSDDERQFCWELFTAMFEATADKAVLSKLVYPYDFETAYKRLEASYYHANSKLNQECAHAIDDTINASCYRSNYYNLEVAAMKAVLDYGFNRVNLVLAFNIQQKEYDGRLSSANKQWAKGFTIQEKEFSISWLKSHSILIDDFLRYTRNLYTTVDAGRFALPGHKEHGESKPVHEYQIIRSITFRTNRGFAIAHNPNAPNPYVCWQFTVDNSERDYYWGFYVNSEQSAIDNYIARVFIYLSDEGSIK